MNLDLEVIRHTERQYARDYHFGNETKVTVSLIKDSNQTTVSSNMSDVLAARQSYSRYGEVPMTDIYDLKSAIFLGIADRNEPDGTTLTESITMRIVPMEAKNGSPFGTEDSEMFVYTSPDREKTSAEQIFRERGIDPAKVVSLSRFGSLSGAGRSRSHMLPVNHASVQMEVCRYIRRDLDAEWIMLQLHPALQTQHLAYENHTLDFTPAEKTLCLPATARFTLNRADSNVFDYMTSYPGYFFDFEGLKSVLSQELDSNLSQMKVSEARHFIPLIQHSSHIKERLFNEVPDAVYLALFSVSHWEQTVSEFIRYAKEH